MKVLFDIGRTKIRLAGAKDDFSLTDIKLFNTPEKIEDGIKIFRDFIDELKNKGPVDSLVGGASRVVWGRALVAESLSSALNLPVMVENDSAVVALGEAVSGAGRNYPVVGYLTISSGVGGARIVNGQINKTNLGFEPGHQIIDFKANSKLEDLVSGLAVEKRFNQPPKTIIDETIWDELSDFLAFGVNNAIVFWSPDVVVLGGSMMKSPGIKIDRVKQKLFEILKIYPLLPEIKLAELGDVGGIYGALELIKKS
jgi:predicted NBD/HSP70 family sugar kinase